MKNKTKQSKQLLERAIRELPYGHAMNSTRAHIQRALNEIAKIEKTKARKESQSKETPRDKWQLDLATSSLVNPHMATNALRAIENMISQEQSKIQQSRPVMGSFNGNNSSTLND